MAGGDVFIFFIRFCGDGADGGGVLLFSFFLSHILFSPTARRSQAKLFETAVARRSDGYRTPINKNNGNPI